MSDTENTMTATVRIMYGDQKKLYESMVFHQVTVTFLQGKSLTP